MMDLSGLASGFSGGMSSGYDLMAKRRQMIEQAQQQAAQRAIGQGQINAAGAGGGGPPTPMPMPGASPMQGMGGAPPPGGGMPTSTPPLMPQQPHPPMPPQGGPQGPGPGLVSPPPPSPPVPVPGQGGGPMTTPPLMPPRPQASSPGSPPAAAGPTPQPPAFSGATQPTGVGAWADSGQTVNRIFQQLLQQNPDLKKDPMVLFQAAQQQISLMKGVDSDAKAMLAAQVKMRQQDMQGEHYDQMAQNYIRQHQDRLAAIDARLKITTLNNDERTHLQSMRDAEMTNIQGMRDASSQYRTNAMVGLGEDRISSQEATAGARIEELATHDANMEDVGLDRNNVGTLGRDKNSPAAPQLRSRTPTQLGRRGGGGGGQGGGPPPEALKHLKEGTVTTFGNGQKWTLRGGKPVQVK